MDKKHEKDISIKQKQGSDYSISCFDHVVIFEFILPLTNEGKLRNALDALFYKDSVMKRLKSIESNQLEKFFGTNALNQEDIFFEDICNWISDKFRGYSISHVSGRYRAGDLCLLQEAHHFISKGLSYLVDETTAVVKFIFPLGESKAGDEFSFESDLENISMRDTLEIQREYSKIRFLFFKLFVQNIVEVVNEEDEIWMMESGLRNRLYSWKI